MVPTYIEDPCLSLPIEGPEMLVQAGLGEGEVKIDFFLPEGHPRFEPSIETVKVMLGQRPNEEEIERQLHYCILPDDLDHLLKEVATELGLRDSWVPRQFFQRNESSGPPPSA